LAILNEESISIHDFNYFIVNNCGTSIGKEKE